MWTLVQHSAFGHDKNPHYERGIEVMKTSSPDSVREAGGVVFDTYEDAISAAHTWPYLSDPESDTPNVSGSFLDVRVCGLRVYRPVWMAVA